MSRLTGRAAMRLRAAWQIHIDAGRVRCWRCRELIEPGSTEWDLGHTGLAHVEGGDADDVAPEHRSRCNRSEGGKLGNTRRLRPRRRLNEWKDEQP